MRSLLPLYLGLTTTFALATAVMPIMGWLTYGSQFQPALFWVPATVWAVVVAVNGRAHRAHQTREKRAAAALLGAAGIISWLGFAAPDGFGLHLAVETALSCGLTAFLFVLAWGLVTDGLDWTVRLTRYLAAGTAMLTTAVSAFDCGVRVFAPGQIHWLPLLIGPFIGSVVLFGLLDRNQSTSKPDSNT
ncbi:MAG: hypothetical protein ACJAYU_000482 [Bradymonadia bacterium]|jgi:hypothetical protein